MFKIKTASNQTVEITKEQLLHTLIEKVAATKKEDHQILVETIANYLEINGVLKTSNPIQLLITAFSAGYYYKVFLEKNDVTIEIPDANPVSKISD